MDHTDFGVTEEVFAVMLSSPHLCLSEYDRWLGKFYRFRVHQPELAAGYKAKADFWRDALVDAF